MSSRMTFKVPVLTMIAAFGATMISGDATAQQPEDQPEQAQQCRAILSPSTLTASSAEAPEEEQRRQQRVAGTMMLQARLTEDIGNVTKVKIEENSNVKVSLAQQEEGHEEVQTEQQRTEQQQEEQRRQQRQTEEAQGQNHIPLEVDVSEAEEGEWEVTFMGEGNQECTGTLRVQGSGPAH